MHRNDKSKFLLYMEPKKEEKSSQPIDDDVTILLTLAVRKAKSGAANYSELKEPPSFREGGGWKGFHTTDCGERSDNKDHQLQNGMITNSLAPFYVRWYRNSIHQNDWNKIINLGAFYGTDVPEHPTV